MLSCMRTTIEIADALLRRAKKKAAESGQTLREVVETALRAYLSGSPPGRRRLIRPPSDPDPP